MKGRRCLGRPLQPHQLQAQRHLQLRDYQGGLFMAPGTGKTLVAIRSSITPALILCRRDDYLTWQIELENEGYDPSTMFFLRGGDSTLPKHGEYDWVFVTYDLMRNDRVYKWVLHYPFEQVIADEVHLIRHWKAERTKRSIRATRHILRRFGLSGTPISNSLQDIWAISNFIDDGKLFGRDQWSFLQRYFIQDENYGGFFPKKRAKDDMKRRIARLAYSCHEDTVLDLPPVVDHIKSAPMSKTQAKHTEELIEEWETELENGAVIEVNQVITKLQKLKQIASGFMYDEDHKAHWFGSPKLDLLFQLLKDADSLGARKKIVVWCSATAEIEEIARRALAARIGHLTFYGKMSAKQKDKARKKFRDDKKTRLFIAQVDSGVGMNELIVAKDAVYVSYPMRVVSMQQSLRRTRRIGSEMHDQIHYWYLMTEGSVDLKHHKTIQSKMSLADYVVGHLQQKKSLRKTLF